MGDDMAIRSGGMYGNPESAYTLAKPVAGAAMASGIKMAGAAISAGAGMIGGIIGYNAQMKQIQTNLQVLQQEKQYNLKNYKQAIADTFAQNKASFYASGLDFTGTALSVARENKRAMTEDMRMMEYNYDMQKKSLNQQRRAALGGLIGNVAGSALGLLSIF